MQKKLKRYHFVRNWKNADGDYDQSQCQNLSPNIYVLSYLVQTLQFRTAVSRKKEKNDHQYQIHICNLHSIVPKAPDTTVMSKRKLINIECIYATYALFLKYLTQLFVSKKVHLTYRCNFLIVILLIRLHEYTNHFSVYIKLSGHYFVRFKSDIPKFLNI